MYSALSAAPHCSIRWGPVCPVAGSGIRFVTLLPQLTPAAGVGAVGVAGSAARMGVAPEAFAENLQPLLTPDQVATAVTEIAADPDSGPEYQVSGAGLQPLG